MRRLVRTDLSVDFQLAKYVNVRKRDRVACENGENMRIYSQKRSATGASCSKAG